MTVKAGISGQIGQKQWQILLPPLQTLSTHFPLTYNMQCPQVEMFKVFFRCSGVYSFPSHSSKRIIWTNYLVTTTFSSFNWGTGLHHYLDPSLPLLFALLFPSYPASLHISSWWLTVLDSVVAHGFLELLVGDKLQPILLQINLFSNWKRERLPWFQN